MDKTKKIELTWGINYLQNNWIKGCSLCQMVSISCSCVEDLSILDEELLKGFSYKVGFNTLNCTRFTGCDIKTLCGCVPQTPRGEVVRAADIMNLFA